MLRNTDARDEARALGNPASACAKSASNASENSFKVQSDSFSPPSLSLTGHMVQRTGTFEAKFEAKRSGRASQSSQE